MPTVAELTKRIQSLEAWSEGKLDDVVEKLVAKMNQKASATQPEIDALKAEVNSLVSSVEMLNSIVEEVRSESDRLRTVNQALQSQNDALTTRVAELEQYSRLNNIELKNVPCTQGEDCTAILKAVGAKIDCVITDGDIDVVHRVRGKVGTGDKNLIARFCSRTKKQDFITKARKAKLNTNELGFGGSQSRPVYVNDHLTLEKKGLFAKALKLKRERGWKFLWTDNCQIKARKSVDSRVYRITKDADLSVFHSAS